VNMLDSLQRQPIVDISRSPHVRLRPLPLEAVKLADNFWEPRRRINRDVTLPSQYRHLEETGRLDNFRRASGKIGGTRYPWDGSVEINVESEGRFALMLRILAWCEEGAAVEVNSEPVAAELSPGSYANLRRTWRPGDTININLSMPVRRIECHPYVAENAGRVALMRGPLLYCVEQTDNQDVDPRDLVLNSEEPTVRFEPNLLGGVAVLQAEARSAAPGAGWEDRLYPVLGIPRKGTLGPTPPG